MAFTASAMMAGVAGALELVGQLLPVHRAGVPQVVLGDQPPQADRYVRLDLAAIPP